MGNPFRDIISLAPSGRPVISPVRAFVFKPRRGAPSGFVGCYGKGTDLFP